jgi:AraC-like DNA-binding protein
MKENIEKKLSIEEVSKYTGYSTSHFSTLFQQQTQHSPLQYFNLLKVQQAALMLQETDMKINQICFKVGIEDSCYFSRLFTKVTGLSPTQYRKQKGTEPSTTEQ